MFQKNIVIVKQSYFNYFYFFRYLKKEKGIFDKLSEFFDIHFNTLLSTFIKVLDVKLFLKQILKIGKKHWMITKYLAAILMDLS